MNWLYPFWMYKRHMCFREVGTPDLNRAVFIWLFLKMTRVLEIIYITMDVDAVAVNEVQCCTTWTSSSKSEAVT